MLSSKDYDLILNWRKRKIPKEIVFKGIRNAFSAGLMEKKGGDRALSLSRLASYVEEEIRNYRITAGDESSEEMEPGHKRVSGIIERLNKTIKSEKRETVRGHYLKARNKLLELLHSKRDDIYEVLEEIEEDFYNDFYEALPEKEQDKINTEAERRVSGRARQMTEKARRDSLLSFRNELLKRHYGLSNILGDD
ncbi:MAG TPA: hypothetical protein VNN20_11425 [Thermodesulfobacteriota bacterium]|nr:hypothetical protein [Thermodesulfobacteriota bacterium]